MTKKVKTYIYDKQKVKYDPAIAKARRDQAKAKLTKEKKAEILVQKKEALERSVREHKGAQLNSFLSMQANFYLGNKFLLDKFKSIQDNVHMGIHS